jgi:hypothetical protein
MLAEGQLLDVRRFVSGAAGVASATGVVVFAV